MSKTPLRLVTDFTKEDQQITLDKSQCQHLAARRMACHDRILLTDGAGLQAEGIITTLGKKAATVSIEHCDHIPRPTLNLTLLLGVCHHQTMDFMVQKAVELGVAHITLVETAHTPYRLNATTSQRRQIHLQKVMVHALQQSHGCYLPSLSYDTFEHAITTQSSLLVMDPTAQEPMHAELLSSSPTLFIGPEGGFSQQELNLLSKSATRVRLGQQILRCETAMVASVSLVRWLLNDL